MTDDLEARALRLAVKLETRAEHFSTVPVTTKEGAALARLVYELFRARPKPPKSTGPLSATGYEHDM